MKKNISLLIMLMLLQLFVGVTPVIAEEEKVEKGIEKGIEKEEPVQDMMMLNIAPMSGEPFTGAIDSDGTYQLPEEFTGAITIGNEVTSVTVIGNGVESQHINTYIVVASGRIDPLTLTIENLNIKALYNKPGIDFGSGGSYDHILYISGASKVAGGGNCAGIHVPEGVSLAIASGSDESSLEAVGGEYGAGIGGGGSLDGDGGSGGTITVSGGTVTATGGRLGAGIGGGGSQYENGGSGGTITISGGSIEATGGGAAAGIGCGGGAFGNGGSGGEITISGGTVTAAGGHLGAGIGGGNKGSGGRITVFGGSVSAAGGNYGAGIGGGGNGDMGTWQVIPGGSGGTITVSGGSVTATGGYYGAGIGGGGCYKDGGGSGGIITISGGTVTATGGSSDMELEGEGHAAVGIGGGGSHKNNGGAGGTIIINNHPTVIATHGTAAGIADIGNGYNAAGSTIIKRDNESGPDLTYIRLEVQNLPPDTGNKISFNEQEHEIDNGGLTGFFVEKPTASMDITLKLAEDEAETVININPGDVQNSRITLNENITITYGVTTGGTVNPASETLASIMGVAQGSEATASAGYSFVNWTEGGEEISKDLKYIPVKVGIVNVAATYTANFKANTYTVTFNANGGVTPSPENRDVTYDSTYGALATVTRDGYNFNGWFTAASGGTEITSATTVDITAEQMLYAQWEVEPYPINYILDGGTNGDNSESYNIEMVDIILEDAAKPGYTFVGWYDASTDGNKITSILQGSIGNITLYARWALLDYIVTYNGNENTGGNVPAEEVVFHTNDSVIVLGNIGCLEKSGYTFAGWNTKADGSGTEYEAGNEFTMGDDNVILYAQWAKKITVTANSDSKVYDGTPLTNGGHTHTELLSGDSLEVTVTGSITDAGTDSNEITEVRIMNGITEVTENYDITEVNGTLTVTKRPLEITAASASKKHDRTPLTNTGYSITSGSLAAGQTLASVTVTGSQTDPGSSTNAASEAVITDGVEDVTGNYDITYVDGTLVINRRSGGQGTTPPQPTPSQPTQGNVIVIVNGEEHDAGIETKTTEDEKSTVIIEVNNQVIASKINEAITNNPTGTGNAIQVPVADTNSQVAKVELTGDIVKKLAENTFDVFITRDNLEYIIPAEEFTIGQVAENLGVSKKELKDIKVEVKITKPDETVVAKYNEVVKAKGAELIFPPVEFRIAAKSTKSDGTTGEVEISNFSIYVERVIEIPAEVDPSRITTGIVFNPDGTYNHVPTVIYQKDGKWYAKINSLTNSTYSIIWNPVKVKSVENHWAQETVNDMAAKLVIFNPESFEPNKAITRADFAEYIVRALGLYREGYKHENKFTDVSSTGARTLAILIANEYGIVSGYPDGTFRPAQQISREEAMAMLQRAMQVTKLIGSDKDRYRNYTDFAKVSSWAEASVKEALSAHVFNGTSATTISPESNLTYAETAQAIKNLLVESKLINRALKEYID